MIKIVLLFLSTYAQTIKYDSAVLGATNPRINCGNGNTQTTVVNFSGTFANIPKVIITSDKFDCGLNMNFQFTLTSITLTSFTAQLKCGSSYYVTTYSLMWYAIDSPQVEVINCFNIANPSATTTFNHNNPYALYGFISLTSAYTIGSVSFSIAISSINATTVTTQISNLANLTQIGYQIILGVDSAFGNYVQRLATSTYYSPNITLIPNTFFLIPYVGLNYSFKDGIRLLKKYSINSTNVSYILDYWYGLYAGNYHVQVQIPYLDYTTVDQAFKVTYFKIRTLEIFQQAQSSTFQIIFKTLNKQYSDIGTYTLLIDKNTQTTDVNFVVNCNLNEIIISKENYSGFCISQKCFEQTKVCFGGINTIKYFSRLSASVAQEKQLRITITFNSVSITQVVQSGVNFIQQNLVSITKQ